MMHLLAAVPAIVTESLIVSVPPPVIVLAVANAVASKTMESAPARLLALEMASASDPAPDAALVVTVKMAGANRPSRAATLRWQDRRRMGFGVRWFARISSQNRIAERAAPLFFSSRALFRESVPCR